MFHDAFFGRKIRDPADKEICRLLAYFLGGLVLEHPLAGLIDQDILMISRLHRQHGNIGVVEAEQSLVLEVEEFFREIFDQRGVDVIERRVGCSFRDGFAALRVWLIETY